MSGSAALNTVREQHPVFGREIEYVPVDALERFMPQVLPPYWELTLRNVDGLMYRYKPPFGRKYSVIVSIARESDGKLWLHVSLSKWSPSAKTQEEPSWTEIRDIKNLFVGRDRKAIVVLPPQTEYVNIAEVHHLWSCLDGDPLPDFTGGTGSI